MLKDKYQKVKEAIENYKVNGFYPIHYYNFWTDQLAKDIWFSKFIEHHGLLKNKKTKINFYSVLGSPNHLKDLHKGVNIFFSGENMHTERFAEFRSLCKTTEFDLYIDFDTTLNEKSICFPLWLLYTFSPESNEDDIKRKVKELRFPSLDNRQGFCSLVASHDWNGIRGEIMDCLAAIDTITSGGKFRTNTDDLNVLYSNNKYDFIRQYKFNICPENSNSSGYVTEKIFQAIEAGCIPIYWGADNQPESGILNPEAIIFWTQNNDNTDIYQKIKVLCEDTKYYKEFVSHPRLLPDAEDIIWNYFMSLKLELAKLFI